MKKILSIILSILFLFTSINFVYAEETLDTQDEEETPKEVLEEIKEKPVEKEEITNEETTEEETPKEVVEKIKEEATKENNLSNVVEESTVSITEIIVTSSKDEIYTNETLEMSATILPNDASDKNIIWTVKNGSGTATISNDGVLTPQIPGTVTVRAVSADGSGVYGEKQITIKPVLVTNIEIIGNSSLQRTKIYTYRVNINPSDAYNKNVLWNVENITGEATINENGTLTAIKVGTVKIIATSIDESEVYAEKEVEVTPLLVTSITINGDSKVLLGRKSSYKYTINPTEADNQEIIWSVSNSNATIDENGVLTAINTGSVTIKATSTDGSNVYGSKTITITNEDIKPKLILTASKYKFKYVESVNLKAELIGSNEKNITYTWTVTRHLNGNSPGYEKITDYGDGTATLTLSAWPSSGGYLTIKVTANDANNTSTTIDIYYDYSANQNGPTASYDEEEIILEENEEFDVNVDLTDINNSTQKELIYAIEDENVAYIDSNGKLFSSGIGYTFLYILTKYNTFEKIIPISVVEDKTLPLKVVDIELTGLDTVERGSINKYSAKVNPINAANQNIVWNVISIDGEATIDEEGNLTAIKDGQVLVKVTSTDGSNIYASMIVNIMRTYIENIEISGESTIERGKTYKYDTVITPENAYIKETAWIIENITGEATIDENGYLVATKNGTIKLRANSMDGSNTYAEKTITITSIYVKDFEIIGSNNIKPNRKYKYLFNVLTNDADNKEYEINIENITGEATIDENGYLIATKNGTIKLIMTALDEGGYSEEKVINISEEEATKSITVHSTKIYLDYFDDVKLTATINSNESESITWSSSNPSIATVDQNGIVSAEGEYGDVVITATLNDGSGISSSITLHVGHIKLSKNSVKTINRFATYALNVYVESSNNSIVTAGNLGTIFSGGYYGNSFDIRAINNGIADVRMYLASGKFLDKWTIHVETNTSITLKNSINKIEYDDIKNIYDFVNISGNNNISIVSSDPNIVEVDEGLNIYARSLGNTKISIYGLDGTLYKEFNISVFKYSSSIEVDTEDITLTSSNPTHQIEYQVLPEDTTNKNVTFTSLDENVAIVDSNGLIKAMGIGNTIITIKSEDGKSEKEINVIVENFVLCSGIELLEDDIVHISTDDDAYQVKYRLLPEGCANTKVTYSIEDETIAKVDENGVLTALKTGQTILTITNEYGHFDKIAINVNNFIPVRSFNIIENEITITIHGNKKTYQIEYQINPSNATNQNIIWTTTYNATKSVDGRIVNYNSFIDLDENGLITALSPGTTYVYGKTEDGNYTDTLKVNVIYGYDTIEYYYFNRTTKQLELIETNQIYYDEEYNHPKYNELNESYIFDNWYKSYSISNNDYYAYNSINDFPIDYTYSNKTYKLYYNDDQFSIEDIEILSYYIEGDKFVINFKMTPGNAYHPEGYFQDAETNFYTEKNLDSYYVKYNIDSIQENIYFYISGFSQSYNILNVNGKVYICNDNLDLYFADNGDVGKYTFYINSIDYVDKNTLKLHVNEGSIYKQVYNEEYKIYEYYYEPVTYCDSSDPTNCWTIEQRIRLEDNLKVADFDNIYAYVYEYEYTGEKDQYGNEIKEYKNLQIYKANEESDFILNNLKYRSNYYILLLMVDPDKKEYKTFDFRNQKMQMTSNYLTFNTMSGDEFKSIKFILDDKLKDYDVQLYIRNYQEDRSNYVDEYITTIPKGEIEYVYNNVDDYKEYYIKINVDGDEIISNTYCGYPNNIPTFKVEGNTYNSVKITLDENLSDYDVNLYKIEQYLTPEGWYDYNKILLAVIPKGETEYILNGVSDWTNYVIGYVNSQNNEITSSWNWAGPLYRIVSFTASSNSYNSIKITLDNSLIDSNVQIYRSSKYESGYKLITTLNPGTLEYIDKSLNNGYYYKIRVLNDDGTYLESSYPQFTFPQVDKPIVSYKMTSKNSVKLSWNKVTGATGYIVYKCNSTKTSCESIKHLGSTTTSYTISKLSLNKNYYYIVSAERIINYSGYSHDSDVIHIKTAPASAPTLSVSKKDYKSINVKVGSVSGATYYQIYRSTYSTKNFSKIATIEVSGTFVDDTVITSKTYYYKVRACNDYVCGSYSSVKSAKATLSTPSVTLTSNSSKQAVISFNEINGATGYQIYRSTSSTKNFSRIATVSDLSYIDTIPLNKTYYYKVRAYIKINGTTYYGNYSSVKSIKVKLSTPSVTISKFGINELNISWNSITSADGYKIYRSTKKDSDYKLIATTSDLCYINTIPLNKTYYYKVKAYKIVNGTTYYSGYSSIISKKISVGTPNITLSNTLTGININISNVSNATGFEIYRSTSKNGTYKKITTISENDYVDTSVSNRTYYYKVRTYILIGDTKYYSGYSIIKYLKASI